MRGEMISSIIGQRLRAAAAIAVASLALLPATALAQVYEKVDAAQRQEIPAGRFVSAAYGFIWIAVLVYVIFVARGLARTNREIAELKRKLETSSDVKG
jgi:CcmD family protein